MSVLITDRKEKHLSIVSQLPLVKYGPPALLTVLLSGSCGSAMQIYGSNTPEGVREGAGVADKQRAGKKIL